jgi:hypothetical protein
MEFAGGGMRPPTFLPKLERFMAADLYDLASEETIQERFLAFDRANPEVYAAFKDFSLRLLNAGRTHYSADGILHTVRFHTAVNGDRDGGFKIDNNFSSRYARKLAAEDTRFAEFFEFRKIKRA